MYIILTQYFPSRFGGIESLVSNLALNLGKNNNTIVFADQHHNLRDSIYDNKPTSFEAPSFSRFI